MEAAKPKKPSQKFPESQRMIFLYFLDMCVSGGWQASLTEVWVEKWKRKALKMFSYSYSTE